MRDEKTCLVQYLQNIQAGKFSFLYELGDKVKYKGIYGIVVERERKKRKNVYTIFAPTQRNFFSNVSVPTFGLPLVYEESLQAAIFDLKETTKKLLQDYLEEEGKMTPIFEEMVKPKEENIKESKLQQRLASIVRGLRLISKKATGSFFENLIIWQDQPTFDDRIALGPSLNEARGIIKHKINEQIGIYEKLQEKDLSFRAHQLTSYQLDNDLLKTRVFIDDDDIWRFHMVDGYSSRYIPKDVYYYATADGLVEIYEDTEIPSNAIYADFLEDSLDFLEDEEDDE